MNNDPATIPDRAAAILFPMLGMNVYSRVDTLAERLAKLLGPGHTIHTVIEGFKESLDDPENTCRELAILIAKAEGEI
jgi:hypothetical protein